MPIKQADLYCTAGGSDKEYHVQVDDAGNGLRVVNFQYGRRGATLTPGTKTPEPVPEAKADKIFDSLVKEKMGKGYIGGATGSSYVSAPSDKKSTGMLPQLLNPIDEDEVEKFLSDPNYGAQEKKDGKHVMCRTHGGKVTAANKKGFQIGAPEAVVKALRDGFEGTELDGEMIGDTYHVFDILENAGSRFDLMGYGIRHSAMVLVFDKPTGSVKMVPLAKTESEKRALYDRLRAEKKEGIVFKRLDAPYRPGRPESGGDMVKLKFYATLSAIVSGRRDGKRSVSMELLDDSGSRVAVGNVTIPPNRDIPRDGDVIEVRYLYAYKGGSLFQPTLLGVRDDVDQAECLTKQLKYKAEDD